MNRRESVKLANRMEREGWTQIDIAIDGGARGARYLVAATDPLTGVRSPWIASIADYDERYLRVEHDESHVLDPRTDCDECTYFMGR